MKSKILILLLLISICLTSCANIINTTDTTNPTNTVNDERKPISNPSDFISYTPKENYTTSMTSDSAKEREQKMVENEKKAIQYIKEGRHFVDEVNWDADKSDSYASLMYQCSEYDGILGFGGFRTLGEEDGGIIMMGGIDDGYPLFSQCFVSANPDNQYIEYSVLIERDFEEIDTNRYSLFIYLMTNIFIEPQTIHEAIVDGAQHLDEVAQDNPYKITLYDNNNSFVKITVMQDVDDTKYVVIHTLYNVNVKN